MKFKAIALDMMGVVYPTGDDLRELLIPYLQREGIELNRDVIIEAYRRSYRQGESATSFWENLGLAAPHEAIEARLMDLYELSPGARDFLDYLAANEVPTYSLSNDVAQWAIRRRKHLGIDHYFAGSVISGELGVPKPEPAIYQALAKLIPCSPPECLFVDDRPVNVEGAAKVGFATVLFGVSTHETLDCVADFEALKHYIA